VLDSSMHVGDAAVRVAGMFLEKIENGDFKLGASVTLADFANLAKVIEKVGVSVERAMRVARLHAGEPDAVLGIQVGALLTPCSLDELAEIQRTGALPARILGLQSAGVGRQGAIDVEEVVREPEVVDVVPPIPVSAGSPLARPRAGPMTLAELLAKEEPVHVLDDGDDDPAST